jgi:uncharacterized SAM-binding protein YcdF (DUF218 family)
MLADPTEAAPFPTTASLDDLAVVWAWLTGTADLRPTDVLFCFGSFFFGVARRAAALYHLGVAPLVLVSGGAVGRIEPWETEADAYVDVLLESGVPRDRIVVEPLATNTGENVALGMAALEAHDVDVGSATLVAWPTSLRRCVATFARQFPDVRVRTQPAFVGLGPYESTPERAVETSLAELERLRAYPALGFIAAAAIPAVVDRAADRLASPALPRLPLTRPARALGDGPSVRSFAVAPPPA